MKKYRVCFARVCRILGLSRSAVSYVPKKRQDSVLKEKLRALAGQKRCARFGHKRLHALLRQQGVQVNHKRSHRVYKEAGLQVPYRKRKKHKKKQEGLWAPAHHAQDVWAVDFMFDRLLSGKVIKILTVVDEKSKQSFGLMVDTSISGSDVAEFLDMAGSSKPNRIRVDQGTEFTSKAFVSWAKNNNIGLEYTKVRKPNQVIEAFNSRLRDEVLNEEIFLSIEDAREKIDAWHWRYNNINPHSALGMKSPIHFAIKHNITQIA